MKKKRISITGISARVLAVFLMLLVIGFSSCNDSLSPVKNESASMEEPAIGLGELHNRLVEAFLAQGQRLNAPSVEEDDAYLDLYVRTSRAVFRDLGIEFEPDISMLREHFAHNAERRSAGLGDIFRPFMYSPTETIDSLARVGEFCLTDARMFKSIFHELQLRQSGTSGVLVCQSSQGFLTAEERSIASAAVIAAEDLLVHSLHLWSEVLGAGGEDLPAFDAGEADLVASWWKKATKIVCTAGGDVLAGAITGACTANPAAVAFVGALASLAIYEIFDHHGW